MSEPTQAQTEVRGWDEYDELDPADVQHRDHYRQRFGRMPTERELRERPFVSKPLAVRCWCGRPVKESTGACRLGHEWPRP